MYNVTVFAVFAVFTVFTVFTVLSVFTDILPVSLHFHISHPH